MICDVHFGDTRYDITPASVKGLPNDHTEEQTTTKTTTKTTTRTIRATHYTALTQYTFALRNPLRLPLLVLRHSSHNPYLLHLIPPPNPLNNPRSPLPLLPLLQPNLNPPPPQPVPPSPNLLLLLRYCQPRLRLPHVLPC
jgi:hypothetical protein